MKAKGIWKHVRGTAYELKPYALMNGAMVLSDGKTPASEKQIMEHEEKMDEYNRKKNTTRHVILLTTSTRLGAKVKNLKSTKEMWEEVKKDVTSKSTLFIIDAEDELSTMKCQESLDPKSHLTEITAHFNLMVQQRVLRFLPMHTIFGLTPLFLTWTLDITLTSLWRHHHLWYHSYIITPLLLWPHSPLYSTTTSSPEHYKYSSIV